MAQQTTIYDVVTNYVVHDRASGPMNQVGKSATGAAVGMGAVGASSMRAQRGLMMMARTIGPLLGVASAIGVIGKSFMELNDAQNRTIQLGAQFNLAFKVMDDPAQNFVQSMKHARRLTREIIQDAARLPGTSRDFFQIAGLMAGPTFASGRGPADLRRMVANIAMSAGFAGQTQEAAARQGFRMITGQATVGDNPLFASMLSAGLVPEAAKFNALALTERFQTLDDAMKQLVGNPMFRKEILGTLEVQLGTLSDLLLGSAGIAGQAFGDNFTGMIEALMDFNTTLEGITPEAVAGLRLVSSILLDLVSGVASGVGMHWGVLGSLYSGVTGESFGQTMIRQERGYAASGLASSLSAMGVEGLRDISRPGRSVGFPLGAALAPFFEMEGKAYDRGQLDRAIRQMKTNIDHPALGPLRGLRPKDITELLDYHISDVMELDELNLAGKVTNNTFNVKIDLKSDDSPEAIALNFKTAMQEITSRAPTSDVRAPRVGVQPGAI